MQQLNLSQPFLRTGDSAGSWEMVRTFTDTWDLKPPTNQVYHIDRIIVDLEDAGINSNFYGGSSALTNGIVVSVNKFSTGDTINILTGFPIKRTFEWSLFGDAAGIHVQLNAGPDEFLFTWFLSRHITLDWKKDIVLRVYVRDILGSGGAALSSHIMSGLGIKFVL